MLAIVIYVGIALHWGDDVIPFHAMTEGMDFSKEDAGCRFPQRRHAPHSDGKELDATDYSINWDIIQPGARVGVRREGRDTVITVSDEYS